MNDEKVVASVETESDLLTASQKALIRTASADKLNSVIARLNKLKAVKISNPKAAKKSLKTK